MGGIKIAQIRLMLGENPDDGTNINGDTHSFPNYVVTAKDEVEKLTVPSGYQTGIKLVHGFKPPALHAFVKSRRQSVRRGIARRISVRLVCIGGGLGHQFFFGPELQGYVLVFGFPDVVAVL